MYETYFGLHRQLFQCAELQRAFLISESIRKVLPQLLHALRADLGIAVLTGHAGVGKTSLLKHLASLFLHEGRAVVCSGVALETTGDLLRTLHRASQMRAGDKSPAELPLADGDPSRWDILEQLRRTTEFWGPVILLVDDAQLLPVTVLNELRAITEEDWNGLGLVRCLICGPISFEEDLARSAYADFSRRIRCHAILEPLTTCESVELLRRHLQAVGGSLQDLFTISALELIAVASDGLPRCLSLLADESLVVACETTNSVVDEDCVRAALARLQHLPYPWNASPRPADLETLGADTTEHSPPDLLTATTAAGIEEHTENRQTGAASTEDTGLRVIEFGTGIQRTATAARTAFQAAGHTPYELNPEPTHAASEIVRHVSTFVEAGVDTPVTGSEEEICSEQPAAASLCQTATGSAYEDNSPSGVVRKSNDVSSVKCTSGFWSTSGPVAVEENGETEPVFGIEECLSLSGQHQSAVEAERCLYPDSSQAAREKSAMVVSHIRHHPEIVQRHSGDASCADAESLPSNPARRWPPDMAGRGLSDQQPVFDRYTWIALGRDVPTGTLTASASVKMREAFDHWNAPEVDAVSGEQCVLPPHRFNHVEITQSTDQEIASLWVHANDLSQGGRFINTESGSQIQGWMVGPFHAVQPDCGPSDESNSEPRANVEIVTVSDPQEVCCEIASDSAFSNVDDSWQLLVADQVTFERMPLPDELPLLAETPSAAAATESFVSTSEKRLETRWVDGQLVSGSAALPTSTRQYAGGSAQPCVAADKTDNQRSGPASVVRFFSLPEETRATAADLRSSLLREGEMLPLAESVVALREELTTFQQSEAHHRAWDPFAPAVLAAEASKDSPDALRPRLVPQARRRIEDLAGYPESDGERRAITQTPPVSLQGSTVSMESAASNARNSPAQPPLVTENQSLQFRQLFTKLRKMRHEAARQSSR